jgi:NAD(P)H-nitrite reductase large subunit
MEICPVMPSTQGFRFKNKNFGGFSSGQEAPKTALALHQHGLAVTLVEQDRHLAPMQFDKIAGEILAQALEAQGIHLIFGQTVPKNHFEGFRYADHTFNFLES